MLQEVAPAGESKSKLWYIKLMMTLEVSPGGDSSWWIKMKIEWNPGNPDVTVADQAIQVATSG